ncbi:hypothetical protein S1OALGB6SA_300 [Olavius algarvensis spirochete endosymbiont]|nr:hypothetical protein S1OALGB6SA_300 [Olavius algarvensis spirochete endosymbiont]
MRNLKLPAVLSLMSSILVIAGSYGNRRTMFPGEAVDAGDEGGTDCMIIS